MASPLNLAYLTTGGLRVGGTPRMIANLITTMDRAHLRPSVVILEPCRLIEETLGPLAIPIHRPDPERPFLSLIERLRGADIVHIKDSAGNLRLYFAARAACRRVIETLEGVQVGKAFFPDMQTICIAQHIRDLQPVRDRCVVIPNATLVPPALTRRPPSPVARLLQVGRPSKFLHSLADLMPRLDAVPVHATVVGTAGRDSDRIRFIPHADRVEPLLDEADLLVHFPREESFGHILIEALAHGAVPVASAAEGPREIIEHGRTGFLLDDDSQAAAADLVAKAVRLALDEPARIQAMREAGHDRARTVYSLDASARHHARLYDEVIQEPPVSADSAVEELVFHEALDAYFGGKFETCLQRLQACGANGRSYGIHLFTALSAAKAGTGFLAHRSFTALLDAYPENLFALNACAEFRRRFRPLKEYLELVERSLAISPHQLEIYTEAAEILCRQQRWEEAEQYLLRLQNVVLCTFPFFSRRFERLWNDFKARRSSAMHIHHG